MPRGCAPVNRERRTANGEPTCLALLSHAPLIGEDRDDSGCGIITRSGSASVAAPGGSASMAIATPRKRRESRAWYEQTGLPIVVRLRPVINLSEDEFFELCRINRDVRIERNAEGELLIMPPAGGDGADGGCSQHGHEHLIRKGRTTRTTRHRKLGAKDSGCRHVCGGGSPKSPSGSGRPTRMQRHDTHQQRIYLSQAADEERKPLHCRPF